MRNGILANSLILSFGILAGRLSGYVRELIIAYKFEVSSQADTIILILAVPDLLNNVLAAGAVSGILIPLLHGSGKVSDVISEFTQKLFVISLVFYALVVGALFFSYETYMFGLLAVSLLSVFPNIFTFIHSSYLQYEKRFKAQSLNTLIFNTIIVIALLVGAYDYVFAIAVIAASLVRMVWIGKDLRHTSLVVDYFPVKVTSGLVGYQTLGFMICANGLIFVNPMLDKIFASFLEDGSVAILSYSEKIYLLPVSVFLTTYAVAMFPDLSKMIAKNDSKSVNKILKKAIAINLLISAVVATCMYVWSLEIVGVFYGIAGVNDESQQLISQVLNGYLLSLLFAGTNAILLNVFFANKWYSKLMYYSIFMLVGKVMTNAIIVYYGYDVFNVAMSTSAFIVLSVLILLIVYVLSDKKRI